jgi:hypothetical protein
MPITVSRRAQQTFLENRRKNKSLSNSNSHSLDIKDLSVISKIKQIILTENKLSLVSIFLITKSKRRVAACLGNRIKDLNQMLMHSWLSMHSRLFQLRFRI